MVDIVVNGETTFLDMNGDPLSGGLVYFYLPNTGTFANTYQDAAGTILNTNPVVLDQAGRAVIWSSLGPIRQVVTDQFGTVQWDRTAAAGITSQDLSVTNLFVTAASPGGADITGQLIVGGQTNIGGNLDVKGNNSLFENGVDIEGQLYVASFLQVKGGATLDAYLTVDQGTTINPAPGNPVALDLTGNIALTDGTTGGGNTVSITSGNAPCFSVYNTTATAIGYGMWNASDNLNWGTVDSNGRPITTLMDLANTGALSVGSIITSGGISGQTLNSTGQANIEGNLTISGNSYLGGAVTSNSGIFPATNLGCDLGSTTLVFNNVYAHNYITVSTDAASPLLEGGQLDIVVKVPVKTLPHVGIAEVDAAGVGLVEGGGMNYNAVVGVLWKALQELKMEFDRYVAAHP